MKKCIITVADNMSDGTYQVLLGETRKKFGQELEIERVTDNSIIGGFVLNIDGEVFDLSIAAQLKEMKKYLSE